MIAPVNVGYVRSVEPIRTDSLVPSIFTLLVSDIFHLPMQVIRLRPKKPPFLVAQRRHTPSKIERQICLKHARRLGGTRNGTKRPSLPQLIHRALITAPIYAGQDVWR